jgi:hypothetical protein
MTGTIPDLWPASLEVVQVVPPVAILRQQGALLGQRTQNLVYGEVHASEASENQFHFDFDLMAPVLGEYRYRLFSIRHGLSLYPVEILTAESETPLRAADQPQFLDRLRSVLASAETQRVVGALLAQSKAWESP